MDANSSVARPLDYGYTSCRSLKVVGRSFKREGFVGLGPVDFCGILPKARRLLKHWTYRLKDSIRPASSEMWSCLRRLASAVSLQRLWFGWFVLIQLRLCERLPWSRGGSQGCLRSSRAAQDFRRAEELERKTSRKAPSVIDYNSLLLGAPNSRTRLDLCLGFHRRCLLAQVVRKLLGLQPRCHRY